MVVMGDEETLTPAQAGRLLGVTAERVRQLSEAGRLDVVRTPLGRLYRRRDIEALKAKRSSEQPA